MLFIIHFKREGGVSMEMVTFEDIELVEEVVSPESPLKVHCE